MANNNIPDDIILIILSRLPVKSVVRFKAVSRSWRTLISSPRFVRMHLDRSKLLHDNLFIPPSTVPTVQGYSLVAVQNLNFQTESLLGRPTGGVWDRVLCACDGMVLLMDSFSETYMLWNPSTRNQRLLRLPYRFVAIKFGICYDPVTMDDFKVMIVSDDYYAVYSFKKLSWTKRREFPFDFHGIVSGDSGIFFNGAIYWVANREPHKGREIIYFDPKDDGFKTLDKPKGVTESDIFNLVDLRGCLCLYCEIKDNALRIWRKGEVSWKELMVIENVEGSIKNFELICFVEDNNMVIRLGGAIFVVYSPIKKTFRIFEETRSGRTWTSCPQTLLFPFTNNSRPKRKRIKKGQSVYIT